MGCSECCEYQPHETGWLEEATMLELLTKTLAQTAVIRAHTWPYLAFAVLVAAVLTDQDTRPPA